MRAIQELFCWQLLSTQTGEQQHLYKRRSIERILSAHRYEETVVWELHKGRSSYLTLLIACRYGYSQVSLEYLWIATRMLDDVKRAAYTGRREKF